MRKGKPPVFQLKTQTVVVIGIAAALYGLLSFATSYIPMGGNSLRPAVVILTLFGALYGPLVGFFAGFFGNVVGDLITGQIWINWCIGNGVLGMFAGFIYLHKRFNPNEGKFNWIHCVLILFYSVIGNAGGLGLAGTLDYLLQGIPPETVYSWIVLPTLTNLAFQSTLGLILITAFTQRKSNKNSLEIER
ncbi:ECF-type riboflavin transporter substrate-binding protein [Risungbinella massiliensis]|uniref:ECF-type riboflavin transporter substrate-binding protein n=1 Tax=Risungbinella massiliensis TaxID=1329796 RepID=UPI0005CBBD7B|nr:ECF-type riboflavin transporter substrate-binding protein [Risungbinella massiliensis]